MKRLIALPLLLLIFFNTIGYYYVLLLIETNQLTEAIAKISESENEISGNLLIKIPLSMPYGRNDSEYKRAYGEFALDGQVYHFVKKKVYNDTLFVICLRDTKATEIKKRIHDHSKSYSDQQQDQTSGSKEIIQSPAKFCISPELLPANLVKGWSSLVPFAYLFCFYNFGIISRIFHPPSSSSH